MLLLAKNARLNIIVKFSMFFSKTETLTHHGFFFADSENLNSYILCHDIFVIIIMQKGKLMEIIPTKIIAINRFLMLHAARFQASTSTRGVVFLYQNRWRAAVMVHSQPAHSSQRCPDIPHFLTEFAFGDTKKQQNIKMVRSISGAHRRVRVKSYSSHSAIV